MYPGRRQSKIHLFPQLSCVYTGLLDEHIHLRTYPIQSTYIRGETPSLEFLTVSGLWNGATQPHGEEKEGGGDRDWKSDNGQRPGRKQNQEHQSRSGSESERQRQSQRVQFIIPHPSAIILQSTSIHLSPAVTSCKETDNSHEKHKSHSINSISDLTSRYSPVKG